MVILYTVHSMKFSASSLFSLNCIELAFVDVHPFFIEAWMRRLFFDGGGRWATEMSGEENCVSCTKVSAVLSFPLSFSPSVWRRQNNNKSSESNREGFRAPKWLPQTLRSLHVCNWRFYLLYFFFLLSFFFFFFLFPAKERSTTVIKWESRKEINSHRNNPSTPAHRTRVRGLCTWWTTRQSSLFDQVVICTMRPKSEEVEEERSNP